jgi:HEAT repeat protein
MPIRIEALTNIVIWLIIAVVAAITIFVLAIIQRRINRRRYFEALDRDRQRMRETVDSIFEKEPDLESAVSTVKTFRSKAERQALEEAFFRQTKVSIKIALTRQILTQTGQMREWIDILRSRAKKPSGEAARILAEIGDDYRRPPSIQRIMLRLRSGFMKRSIAANKLARVLTPEGMCALVAGLTDPHPDVQEICIRNLGNSADPAVLPVLLEELVKVLQGRSRISVRSVKTALCHFPLEAADGFLPILEGADRRARFLAADVLREIADRRAAVQGLLNKNDFSPALYRLFTERLCQDEWGDVRARAAKVIAHFHDPPSYKILEKLSQDEAWFVRLQTCRALAHKFFLPVAPALAERLTDSHWLVREAAVRSLMEMGDVGINELIQAFLLSTDRYTAEQISEELQRSGLLITLLDSIGEPEQHSQVQLVIRKMISIGKIAMLLAYLISPVPSVRKQLLIPELSVCPSPDCEPALSVSAEADPDPAVRAAAREALRARAAFAPAQTTPPTLEGN